MVHAGACVVLLILVDSSLSLVNNSMIEARNVRDEIKDKEIPGVRRAYQTTKTVKSTSSESGDKSGQKSSTGGESLGLSATETSSEEAKKKINKLIPKSSEERHGWKKWHRKCTPCPEDMKMKWTDPRILWICGAFQRARRTFKSLCMMHYRNCQDGTMFVKIHDHRCKNSSNIHPIGEHFFYEYRVRSQQSESSSVDAISD